MEGFFMENSPVNVRRSSFCTVNNNGNLYGGSGFNNKTPQYNYSLHPSSINQLLLNTNYNIMPSLIRRGSPPSHYSSLPLPHHQPPLLPLPLKFASLPAAPAAKSKNQKRKKKTQKPKITEIISKPVQKVIVAKEEEEEETEEEFLIGSPSSVRSPPPSSLPLPRLLLVKLRSGNGVAVGSCTVEAKVGIDAGTTDDLRKLLRL